MIKKRGKRVHEEGHETRTAHGRVREGLYYTACAKETNRKCDIGQHVEEVGEVAEEIGGKN